MKHIISVYTLFERFRDHFISADVLTKSDVDIRYKYRLVAGMAIITISVAAWFIALFPFISEFAFPSNVISTAICSIALGIHGYILLTLKNKTQPNTSAHQLVSSTFIVIILGLTLTGGPLKTITSAFLTLPILMAFLMLGRTAGIIYTLTAVSSFLVMSYLNLTTDIFIQTIPASQIDFANIFLWVCFASTLLCLVTGYSGLVDELISEREKERERLAYLATHDTLTDLANRQKFDHYLNEAIHRSRRVGTTVGLFIIDLNKFKQLNDSFGHDAGDAALVHVANQLKQTIRTDDLAARLGGDEFAIIVQGDYSIDKLEALANRIYENISSPFDYHNKVFTTSASIGVARLPEDVKNEDGLRKAADRAMYTAKKKEKKWRFYEAPLEEKDA